VPRAHTDSGMSAREYNNKNDFSNKNKKKNADTVKMGSISMK
jgi:hypothetical protein